MGTKNENENDPDPFFLMFLFFSIFGNKIRAEKYVRAFRNKITNRFGAQIRLHQRFKTAEDFARGATVSTFNQ